MLKGDACGNPDYASQGNDPFHHANVLRKAAAGGLKARGCANFFVDRALGKGPLATVVTLAAGNVVVDHHAIAESEPGYAQAHFDNGSSHFMAEDAGSGVGAGMDFLQIGAADAAGGNLDQQFSGADFGHRHGLHADLVHAAIDGGTHGGGNFCFEPVFSRRSLDSHYAF